MQLHMQADGMRPKISVLILFIILCLNCLTFVSLNDTSKAEDPVTYYVDDDNTAGPWDGSTAHPYRYIQDAIGVASPGERIQVLAGTYSENLIIRSNKTSIDLFGEDKSTTIITGGGSGDVLTISATGVDVSDFTIKSSGTGSTNAAIKINASDSVIVNNIISNSKYGFYIYNCSNTKIYYNSITTNSREGIYIMNSDYNNITYSTITSSSYNGIFLYDCSYNTIDNCQITSNNRNGIYLNATCDYNTITNNYIVDNSRNGIYLNDHCENNDIKYHNGNNKIYSNSDSGIRLENSSLNDLEYNIVDDNSEYGIMVLGENNTIHNSTISSNNKHGLFLFGDNDNVVMNNLIQGNTKDGIRIQNSTSDTIYSNRITQNSQYGLYLNYYSVNTLIYNNYFYDNSENAFDMSENNNIWNITESTGYNIVNGANSVVAGNYWDDYDSESEGAYDNDNDYIADSGRSISISSTDNAPLLDSVSPSIGYPSASPDSQTIGSYTYISATITDNTKVEQVRLVVTDPNGDTSTISITQYQTGNIYYYNHQFSTVGEYSYYIKARDPRNWANSSIKTFEIEEGTAPTITDNTADTGSPGSRFLFNATVTDDSDEASELTVKFDWSHGSRRGNYTLYPIGEDIFINYAILDNSTSDLTYTIYASDRWGNTVTTTEATVSIEDTEPPSIIINEDKHGSTSDELHNSFTFGATITDDVDVETAYIEYWYEGSNIITADMDNKGNNYYEKVIILENDPDRVYCVIYATDPSGNINDTKTPRLNFNAPYWSAIGGEITFDASESYDLDGNITSYSWTFGDGATGSGDITTHAYSSNGVYTITVIITDDDGNTKTNTSYANINSTTQQKTTQSTMQFIEDIFGITLSDLFYCYDSDGDSIADKFIDPNNALSPVHDQQIEIENDSVFLLSIDDSELPEFIWNADTDEIILLYNVEGKIIDKYFDETNNQIDATVKINKTTGWIYLAITDPDLEQSYGEINGIIIVTRDGMEIESDKIIRKKGKTYILDDPDVEYIITYGLNPTTLKDAVFTPEDGSIIDGDNSTITIYYNLPVTLKYLELYQLDEYGLDIAETGWTATDEVLTTDYQTYYFTFPPDLVDGEYKLYISVEDSEGNRHDKTVRYQYNSFVIVKEETSILPIILMLFGIFGIVFIIFLLIKYQKINFESFIYFKNRKIIPFFKPIVFGPIKIDVNDEKVKKAEFYVNGKLKETITKAPYTWMWDEKAFLKHNIEAKIFDEEGNSTSSGEMTFYLFNPPKLFK